MKPKGHEAKSATHRRAIAAGFPIKQHCNVDEQITLIDYGVPGFTFAYFKDLPGCYRLRMPFDQAAAAWHREEVELDIARVAEVKH
jgi:hypothetical protein